jgi:predicted nucleic acid-binding protein
VKIVLDTDVVVAALRSPSGASAALVRLALNGDVTLVANTALVLEYEAVAKRQEHFEATGLSRSEFERDIGAIIGLCVEAPSYFRWRPQLVDPDDEMVLEAALNGGAAMIVTFNIKDFASVPDRFGKDVVRPAIALERIRRWRMQ